MKKITLFGLVVVFLSSCGKQDPAPIEYGTSLTNSYSSSNSRNDEVISSKKIVADEFEDAKTQPAQDLVNEQNVLKDKREAHQDKKKYISEEESEPKSDLKVESREESEIKQDLPNKSVEHFDDELNQIEKAVSEDKSTNQNLEPDDGEFLNSADEIAEFIKPIKSDIINKYGDLVDGAKNSGVNFAAVLGQDVFAAQTGTVAHVMQDTKFGNIVIIKHEGNIQTAYAHLQKALVKQGSIVSRGSVIGTAGQTGEAQKVMLHFAVKEGNKTVDPMKYLNNALSGN